MGNLNQKNNGQKMICIEKENVAVAEKWSSEDEGSLSGRGETDKISVPEISLTNRYAVLIEEDEECPVGKPEGIEQLKDSNEKGIVSGIMNNDVISHNGVGKDKITKETELMGSLEPDYKKKKKGGRMTSVIGDESPAVFYPTSDFSLSSDSCSSADIYSSPDFCSSTNFHRYSTQGRTSTRRQTSPCRRTSAHQRTSPRRRTSARRRTFVGLLPDVELLPDIGLLPVVRLLLVSGFLLVLGLLLVDELSSVFYPTLNFYPTSDFSLSSDFCSSADSYASSDFCSLMNFHRSSLCHRTSARRQTSLCRRTSARRRTSTRRRTFARRQTFIGLLPKAVPLLDVGLLLVIGLLLVSRLLLVIGFSLDCYSQRTLKLSPLAPHSIVDCKWASTRSSIASKLPLKWQRNPVSFCTRGGALIRAGKNSLSQITEASTVRKPERGEKIP
ncbi:hypothetical protein MA16_Dca006105 [Dendrobium catenatum]|uniref:Uncharacterized protein n=1 Tax=Dendrobium catenatum TaxID=906689 RepID=A0A2I0X4I6_9ASPA|nr:hypothetical protein MA16_Dca006105 [Dendrobium catenatum]